jgi:hypothetical protein
LVVSDLPKRIRTLTEAFVAELDSTLGPRFVGLFQYGAVCFPPSPVSDFDAHVIVADPFSDDDRRAITAMLQRLHSLPLGDDMDVWYITRDAASRSDPPQTELRPGFRDESWALHRAHVHAGRFVGVRGPDPRTIVPEPTWDEIDEALQGELEYVFDHLEDAPAFGVLNLCRVLYSYETRDVVTSKLRSAVWAFASLPSDHHALIRAALDAYATKRYRLQDDVDTFANEMGERIEHARTRSGDMNER